MNGSLPGEITIRSSSAPSIIPDTYTWVPYPRYPAKKRILSGVSAKSWNNGDIIEQNGGDKLVYVVFSKKFYKLSGGKEMRATEQIKGPVHRIGNLKEQWNRITRDD